MPMQDLRFIIPAALHACIAIALPIIKYDST